MPPPRHTPGLVSVLSAGLLATSALAHPGGGIVALSDRSALLADPTENIVWQVEPGREPQQIVSRFHGHWMTRGRDGNLYVEAFQESGGAWSSAAFRLELPGGRLTEIAHRDELGALAFAVDRDGSLVFQRGTSLVSRQRGTESPFRPHPDRPGLGIVSAYAWGTDGDLVLADRNRILRVDAAGVTTQIAVIHGTVLEPRIWNAGGTPSVFSLALEPTGRVLAAVPDLGAVYRLGPAGAVQEIARSEDGWRATGVATFGDSIFLMESDSRASTSPRLRILRPDGRKEVLSLPPRVK